MIKGQNGFKHRYLQLLCGILFAAILFVLFNIEGYCAEDVKESNPEAGSVRLTVDPTEDKDGFSGIHYDIRNGLPTSEANDIAQTSEGFIWIGSYAGLIRFDGNEFVRLDYLSEIANVRSLYVDLNDRLWVGTNDAGVYLVNKGDVTHFDKSNGLESLSVRGITEDVDGSIYLATASGVGVIDPNLDYKHMTEPELEGQSINLIRADNSGIVYGITITGDLFSIEKGKLKTFIEHSDFPYESILSLQPDPENKGFIYLGTENYIYYGALGDRFLPSKEWGIAPLLGARQISYIDSHLWICGRNGLGKLDGGVVKTVDNIPMDNSFDRIITDSEGNLWVSSSRQGILKIVPNQFLDLFSKYGIPAEVTNSTCHYDGALIIGSERGLITIAHDVVTKSLPVTEAKTASGKEIDTNDLVDYLDGIRIRNVMTDSRNRLWIGTAREYGLLRYDHGKLLQFTEEDGLVYNTIRNVEECSDGSFLVSTNAGINIIRGDRVVDQYDKEDGFSVSFMLCVTEGFDKEIIAGSDGGGIYIIKDDEIKNITTDDGLGSDVILRIKKSTTRDCYWIVTGNSLAIMSHDYKVSTLEDFPYSNNYDIYENSDGDLWVLGSSGIYVVPSKYFDGAEGILPIFFGIANGLPYVTTANSFSELTPGKDLYMAGNEGVVLVNINKPLEGMGDLKLVLPYLDADGTHIYPDSDGNFNIPGSTTRVTIYPYVLNYSLINPQVSYQLVGFDSTDYNFRKNELAPATYTNLSVGSYDFVLSVKDPISHKDTTATFHIIKGRQLSTGAAGSIILDGAALMFLIGLIVYTSHNRKRGRIDDRLFNIMIMICIGMCITDTISYLVEGSNVPFGRSTMILANTLFYSGIIIIPYLYYLYLEYRRDKDCFNNMTKYVLIGIPCFITVFIQLLNVKTGWVFRITRDNEWRSGPIDEYLFIPVIFYAVLIFNRLLRVNRRLAFLGILIVATRFLSEIWMQYVSSTAYTYAVALLCIHIYAISKEMIEEET